MYNLYLKLGAHLTMLFIHSLCSIKYSFFAINYFSQYHMGLNVPFKDIQAVRIEFFCLLKVANIRCFILIKCSEQEARFKKYAIMS